MRGKKHESPQFGYGTLCGIRQPLVFNCIADCSLFHASHRVFRNITTRVHFAFYLKKFHFVCEKNMFYSNSITWKIRSVLWLEFIARATSVWLLLLYSTGLRVWFAIRNVRSMCGNWEHGTFNYYIILNIVTFVGLLYRFVIIIIVNQCWFFTSMTSKSIKFT